MTTNDPLGLFDSDANSDPLGLFEEDKNKHSSFLQNVGGTAAALGDIAAGLIKMPAGIGAAIGGQIHDALAGNPTDLEVQRNAGQAAVEDLFPSIGHSIGGENTDAYRTIMKPFDLLGEGINWVGDRAAKITGSQDIGGAVKLGSDIAALGVGVPGAELLGRGAKATVGFLDPGIRNAGKSRITAEALKEAQKRVEATQSAAEISKSNWMNPREVLPEEQAVRQKLNDMQATEMQDRLSKINDQLNREEDIRADATNNNLAVKLRDEVANRGEEPIYVDPQGQAFRGTPDEPNARLALEKQGEAMDKTMTHLRGDMVEGEPLKPLTDPEIMAHREIADQALRDMGIDPVELQRAADKERLPNLTEQPISSKTRIGRQRGAINPFIFKDGYEAVKKVGEYTMKLIGDSRYPSVAILDKEGKQVGGVDFGAQWHGGEQHAVTDMVHIDPNQRGKGLAQEAYKFLAEQGNDIRKSDVQLPAGAKMWDRFEKKGISSNGKISRQRGAIDIREIINGVRRFNIGDRIRMKDGRVGKVIGDKFITGVNPEKFDQRFREEHSKISERYGLDHGWGETAKAASDAAYKRVKQELLDAGDLVGHYFPRVDFGDGRGRLIDGSDIQERLTGPRPVSPGNKQTGGIFLNNFFHSVDLKKDAEKFRNGQAQRFGDIPKDPDIAKTKEQAINESDSGAWNMTEAGSILAAMKRGSTLVRDGARIVQNAMKRGDWAVNQFVRPVERSVARLSLKEADTLWNGVLKEELLSDKKYDPSVIAKLSPKMQEAYLHFRRMFDDTFEMQNAQRKAEDEKPITKLEAYVASRWRGDFRRPLFEAILDEKGNPKLDAEGNVQKKLVWYLAGDSVMDLNRQTKALLKDRPDLLHDPKYDHRVKYFSRKTDLQAAYTRALDVLGRDDPAVQKLREAAEKEALDQARSFAQQEKHFETKAGIRGFVGDRPYYSEKAGKEALAGLQEQINSGKNAYRWAELQKAGDSIKQLITDPEIKEKQPNNVQYVKELYKAHLGFGEAPAVAHMADSIRYLGISPKSIAHIIANTKSFFIIQKLALNTKTSIMNMLQSFNTLPHLTDVWWNNGKAVGHDPVSSMAVGIPAGIALATKHYGDFLRGKGPGDALRPADRAFFQKAFKYAEDNMVTTHTIYHEAPIEKTTGVIGKTGATLGHAIGIPETTARSVAFMSFVHALRGAKEFKGNDAKLFQKAEELTYASMGDYRSAERAMFFQKLGAVGNLLNTLQTYPMNQLHQWNYFGRQAAQGNIGPLMTAFAVQYAMAGIMGLPLAKDLDKLYKYIKDNVISTNAYVQAQKSDFWADPKLWMIDHWGNDAVDGWVADKTGLGISTSLSSVMPTEMLSAPGAPAVDIIKQAMTLGKAAIDPTNSTKWAQVGMASLPAGVPQGMFEQSDMMKGTTWNERYNQTTGQTEHVYGRPGDIESRTGVVTRTPEEETIRRFGIKSEREVRERELGYRIHESNAVANQRAKDLIDPMYDAIRRGDKERAKDLYKAYVELTGQQVSPKVFEEKAIKEFTTTPERDAMGNVKKSVSVMINLAKYNKLLDQIKKESMDGNK